MDEIKQYKIFITYAAEEDIGKIVDYLNTFSEKTAADRFEELIAGIYSLREMPFRCPAAKVKKFAEMGYRYLIIRNYLVFYVVTGDVVNIKRVIDGRSNYL